MEQKIEKTNMMEGKGEAEVENRRKKVGEGEAKVLMERIWLRGKKGEKELDVRRQKKKEDLNRGQQ